MTRYRKLPSDRSRDPAVAQPDPSPPRAAIQYCDATESIPVEIRDLSDSGAGFIVAQAPRLDSIVVFTVYHRGKIDRIQATISWARPESDGLWSAGCRFEGRMRTGAIAAAGARGRRAANIQFQIRCQLNPEVRATARIVDYSNGGLCVTSAESFPPDTKLLFEAKETDPPVRFVATVQWTRNDEGRFRMGCSFVGSCDMKALRQCLPEFVDHTVQDSSDNDSESEPAFSELWSGVRAGLRMVSSAFSTESIP